MTCSNRRPSSNSAYSSFVNLAIFSSTGSPSSATAAAPTYRPGVSTKSCSRTSSTAAARAKPGTSAYGTSGSRERQE